MPSNIYLFIDVTHYKYYLLFYIHLEIIYGKIKADIGAILRKICDQKGVEIIEANAFKDHIHMLVSIPPKLSVSQFTGYLKILYTDFNKIYPIYSYNIIICFIDNLLYNY